MVRRWLAYTYGARSASNVRHDAALSPAYVARIEQITGALHAALRRRPGRCVGEQEIELRLALALIRAGALRILRAHMQLRKQRRPIANWGERKWEWVARSSPLRDSEYGNDGSERFRSER